MPSRDSPAPTSIPSAEMERVCQDGVASYKAGDFARAAVLLSAVIEQAPHYAPALKFLAASQFARNDFAAAEAIYRRLLAGDPNNVEALQGLATSVHEAGRLAEAN